MVHSIAGGAIGVDTVRVGANIDPGAIDLDRPGWQVRRETRETGDVVLGARRRLDGFGMLDVLHHERAGWWAFLEGSVPKALDPGDNTRPATVTDLLGWVDAASQEDHAGFLDEYPLTVNRLDCVRDFHNVRNPSTTIKAYASAFPSGHKIRSHHLDPTRNNADTVTVRTKHSGSGTLYDKGRESGNPDADILRFEARERKTTLTEALGKGRPLEELTDAHVIDLARYRFAWADFDKRRPATHDQLLATVLADDFMIGDTTPTPKTRLSLYTLARLERDGYDLRSLFARETAARLRRELIASGLKEISDPETVYTLDFDLGATPIHRAA